MMSLFSQNGDRLFVEPLNDAVLPFTVRRLESNPVTNVESGHERRAPRLGDQLQTFDNEAIEKTQVILTQMPNRLRSSISIL